MNSPELVFSAQQATWRLNEKDHAQAAAAGKAVHERNGYTCVYCGAHTLAACDVLHIDDNHANWAEQNLLCVCPLCHQLFHLGCAADEDRACVIYAPEFSQAEINALAIALWLAQDAGGNQAQAAKTIYADLESRMFYISAIVRQWILESELPFHEPFQLSVELLGLALINSPPEIYQQRKTLLGGLRLLPKREPFAVQIEQWRQHYSSVPAPSG